MDTRIPLLVGLLACGATVAAAADWSFKSLFSETAGYDTNRDLAPASPGGVFSAVSSLSMNVLAKSPSAQFSFATHLDYPAEVGPGSTGTGNMLHYGFLAGFEKKSRLDAVKFSASLVPESTRTLQLTDTGEVTLDAVRWTRAFSASLKHQISTLDELNLSTASTRVSYTGDPGPLKSYDTLSASAAWLHRVSRRSDLTSTLGWSQTNPDDLLTPRSNTYSATVGFNASLTRLLSLSTSAGARTTTTEGLGVTTGWIGDATLTYKGKVATYSVAASRSAAPDVSGMVQNSTRVALNAALKQKYGSYAVSAFLATGPGELGFSQNSTGASLNVSHAINELSRATLALSYTAYTSPSVPDRQVLTIAPTYSFQAARHVQGNLAYRFSQRFGGTGNASSSAIFFGLSSDAEILH